MRARLDRLHLAREEIAHLHAVEPAGARDERLDLAVVEDAGAVARRREHVLEAEALREEQQIVEVVAGPAQVLRPHVRLHRERGLGPQHAVALAVLAGGEQVVEPHAEAHLDEAARGAAVHRHQEGQRAHQVRGEALERLLLAQRLAHQLEVAQLEVAEPAVDQLGGLRRGAGGEIALLEQRDRGAAQGQVTRHSRPRHAAADHHGVQRGAVKPSQPIRGRAHSTRSSDGSYHVVRSDRGDSRIVRARDAAQHEHGAEPEAPAHHDVGVDAVAHHHRLAPRGRRARRARPPG